jgi:hypothetical protein
MKRKCRLARRLDPCHILTSADSVMRVSVTSAERASQARIFIATMSLIPLKPTDF